MNAKAMTRMALLLCPAACCHKLQVVAAAIYEDLRLDLASGWKDLPRGQALLRDMQRRRKASSIRGLHTWPPTPACAEALTAGLVLLKGDPLLT